MEKAPTFPNQGLSMNGSCVDEHQVAKECARKAVPAIPENPEARWSLGMKGPDLFLSHGMLGAFGGGAIQPHRQRYSTISDSLSKPRCTVDLRGRETTSKIILPAL